MVGGFVEEFVRIPCGEEVRSCGRSPDRATTFDRRSPHTRHGRPAIKKSDDFCYRLDEHWSARRGAAEAGASGRCVPRLEPRNEGRRREAENRRRSGGCKGPVQTTMGRWSRRSSRRFGMEMLADPRRWRGLARRCGSIRIEQPQESSRRRPLPPRCYLQS